MTGLQRVPFPTAPDLGGEFTFDPTDQRHRFVFNGIWQVGRGFQLSGLYFMLGGERAATTYGGDLRGFGATGSARLRPDGTIVPRNNFTQPVRKRFDLRAQQRIRLGGRVAIDAIAEVVNRSIRRTTPSTRRRTVRRTSAPRRARSDGASSVFRTRLLIGALGQTHIDDRRC